MTVLVDRVLPGMTAPLLVEAQRCLYEAAQRLARDGEVVRFVRCTFVPDQDRCLDVFEATGVAAVHKVNDVAQVPYRWIGEVSEYTAPGSGR